ncbi:helix-turn-helix domain-containing protein [Streptomyces sp. NBRC 109706]|uniref:helix-turn-helix domain-containing protein n=1 Tax=Streptomyces sp. NBRC 109706 TaxID=1550035 RepID=UPI0007839FC6|nr:helix-turn-helix transcriptional regulator [Streptomyces sp. NBRC 109706]
MHEESSIGDRIARLRVRRGLTQEQLADRARLSVDVVRKLEQGRRQTARLATLNALAHALDVETSVLVGQLNTFEAKESEDPPSVLALRQAISPVNDLLGEAHDPDPEDPPTLERLRQSLRSTERIRREGRLADIGAMLPSLIRDAQATVQVTEGVNRAAAWAVLAEAYQVGATTLAALGKEDAAFTALERSMHAAGQSDDSHLETVGFSTLSWILTKQGRLADAEHIALAHATKIEPGFRSRPIDLSLWGILLLRAATAAVRQEKEAEVNELLSLAGAAATRVGQDQIVYATPFGITNFGVAQVNFLVEMEKSREALRAANEVRAVGTLPPTWAARFHVDRAIAHTDLKEDGHAVQALLNAEQTAPEWLRYHATARRVAAELRNRERRRSSPISALADRLGLDA